MAITFIYPIKTTPQNSIKYNTSNKESTIEKDDGADSLNYIMRDKKGIANELSEEYLKKMKAYINIEGDKIIFDTISTALNCSVKNANAQWNYVRNKFKKKANYNEGKKENLQYCIVQNFGTDIDPLLANRIGKEFAEEYLSKYQCIISTHINTGYVHNHIEFNATSFVDGKKFNDCLKTIAEIRKISDRLCEKYNLQVLEDTKEFNLIRYKDSNGKIKYYEPTERKDKLIEGEFSKKNDYRNTNQYKEFIKRKETHLDILKKDIEKIITISETYEDFLQQMHNIGYEVKAKTQNSNWRKHISFKAETWDKFIRDSALGEEYTREKLTSFIAKNNNKKEVEVVKKDKNIMIEESYNYDDKLINSLDVYYRYKKIKKDYEKIKRNEIEKDIIINTKNMNDELNEMIRQASYIKKEREQVINGSKRKQYLLDRINSNLKTLQFVEENNIRSFEQIKNIVATLYEKRNIASEELNLISAALKNANKNIVLMKKCRELEGCINNNMNLEYDLYEKENDIKMLEVYKNKLKQMNLLDEDKQEKYIEKYGKYEYEFKKLCFALENINKRINNYDECVFNISYIDRQNDNKYKKQIEQYYEVKKEKNNKEVDRER